MQRFLGFGTKGDDEIVDYLRGIMQLDFIPLASEPMMRSRLLRELGISVTDAEMARLRVTYDAKLKYIPIISLARLVDAKLGSAFPGSKGAPLVAKTKD